MRTRWCSLGVVLFLLFVAVEGNGQTIVVEWNFPFETDDAAADISIAQNLGKLIMTEEPRRNITFSTAGYTTRSARCTGWQNGSGVKYWSVEFTTYNYNQLTLSCRQRSSGTGPRDFRLQYKTSVAGNWTDLPGGGNIRCADNWTSAKVENLALPADCDNVESVSIRWLMISDSSVSGAAVSSAGASRIDDISIVSALDDPLPVELMTFSGEYFRGDVMLSWSTATERNNYGFDIEKMNVPGMFGKIGFVQGNGTSNSAHYYEFTDTRPAPGKNSYRLKQIDSDGGFEYSGVIEIAVTEGDFPAGIYPNPFNSEARIIFNTAGNDVIKLEVFNLPGQRLYVGTQEFPSAGMHAISLNAGNFSNGIYLYRLLSGRKIILAGKMVVLK